MGVGGEVRLRDTVSATLEDDGHAVDVEGAVFEEVPGDVSRTGLGATTAQRQDDDTRSVCRDQEDGEDAGPSCDGRPYSNGNTEAGTVKENSQEKRTDGADNVFARQNDSVRQGAVTGLEPFAQG